MKDLVDLILMSSLDSKIQASTLLETIVLVFDNRGDQVPNAFHIFPASWQQRYNRLAKEPQLHLLDFGDASQAATAFITPILSEQDDGLTWVSSEWRWK